MGIIIVVAIIRIAINYAYTNNCFYLKFISPWKLFSFSRYLIAFVLTFWSCITTTWLGKVNFKIYDVTTWLSNNCNTHIEVKPLMKNHAQNVEDKLFPDPFLRNKNWVYLCINNLKVLYSLFLLCANLSAIEM